ncbi:TPA: NYN domain-containing protein [Streptococcus suis]|uniref:NYN domain-containing protein n=1 Tax=Streptococcus suis TaxID=1307 RepID=A0A0Z8E4F2_STRSU|nr:NYN domain-containing protein [Streptococcus suis]MCQ8270804.1 NYN domain-containing protein [Streptococcus suis]MCQ8785441.1 NYN domain-containing protein [Streptococcus suis]MDW8720116.1 NYN domain-containing protein [Streptococcus suis]MDY7596073.1 NYN domain-containing protein [Streptococcus suis]MDY7601563.1 NYN domain-containing protein [Streptococcus suis]
MKEKVLIVDGYNMIAFWQATKQDFKKGDLDAARTTLLRTLSHYVAFEQIEVICVFDAHHVPGLRQQYDEFKVSVIFTEEEETADSYIERLSAQLNSDRRKQVSVATSDLNEQWVVFSQGALRVSARELEERTRVIKKDLDKFVDQVELYTPRLNPWSNGNFQALKEMMEEMKE